MSYPFALATWPPLAIVFSAGSVMLTSTVKLDCVLGTLVWSMVICLWHAFPVGVPVGVGVGGGGVAVAVGVGVGVAVGVGVGMPPGSLKAYPVFSPATLMRP